MASLKHRSQSIVLMPNPTTNPKTLDMLQDPTLRNHSSSQNFDLSMTNRRWDRWPGVAVLVGSAQKAPPPLADKGHRWPPVDEIDACNDDLVMTIAEVIAGITIPTENHLILLKDLFVQNPKQLDIKGWVSSPSCPRQTHLRGRRRGTLGAGGTGDAASGVVSAAHVDSRATRCILFLIS
jgi:hypothetical protein